MTEVRPGTRRWTVHRVERATSTNHLLRTMAMAGAPPGTVVVARTQSAGRGRLGRTWASPPGGLWCSVLLELPDVPSRLPLLVAVAAADAARAVSGADVRVKWPNDLVLAGRKVGGILVEALPPHAVVGIGLNVRVDLAALPPEVRAEAGSLLPAGGSRAAEASRRTGAYAPAASEGVDPDEVDEVVEAALDRLLGALAQVHDAERAGRGDEVLARWRHLCVTLGQPVRVATGREVVEGEAVDVDPDGALVVRTPGGVRRLVAGEVTQVRPREGGHPGGVSPGSTHE